MTIRIGILGYGNLGKGVQLAVAENKDMELVAVFTRRDPASLSIPGVTVVSADDAEAWKDKIDVMVICGGSATDLPKQTPALQNSSTSSIALIHMLLFRNISLLSMPLLKKQAM